MSFRTMERDAVVFHTSALLRCGEVSHGFSTRLGGVSAGEFSSLNLRRGGDSSEAVEENYRRFCAAVGADVKGLVLSRQVHEDTIRHVTAADAGKGFSAPQDYSADALVTNEPGLSLMVFSADCVILLLHDPVSRCIGAVHAGWRGTALDLPVKTVREMERLFSARPENIRIAIGAAIGPCCFETHGDVPDAMQAAFGADAGKFLHPVGEKWMVDLVGLNRWRLCEAGVDERNTDVLPLCTACNSRLYWSHRRMGDRRGVQGGLISLKREVSR